MQKLLKGLVFLFKSTIMPHKYYPQLLKKSRAVSIIGVLVAQLIISFFFIAFSAVSPDGMTSEQIASTSDIFYISLIIMPLFFALPAMYFHWIAQLVGGTGKLLNYYQLMLWSILPILLVIITFSFIISLLATIFTISNQILSILMLVQLVPMAFYMLSSLKVAHNLSWFKTILVYVMGSSVIIASKMVFL